jgi:putative DNA primase/helicase
MIEEENTRQTDKPRPDLLRLFARRTMFIDETQRNAILNEGLLKRLSGGTPIVARGMSSNDYEEFHMNAKIWVAFNREPQIKGADDGIWRRIKRVPFYAKFSKEDPQFDPFIKEKLEKNLSAVLRWAVEGAVKWHRHGLSDCDAVEKATSAYKLEQDQIGEFLEESTEDEPGQYIYANVLYREYVAYKKDEGTNSRYIMGRKVFDALLYERGWEKVSKKGKKRVAAWLDKKWRSNYIQRS